MLWLSALAVAGCSGDSGVLARVGSREISRDDFLEAARSNIRQYAATGDSGKLLLLDDLVHRELLIQGAQQLGLYRESRFLAFRENAERELLRARMRRDLLGPLPGVSDAEVAALHALRTQEAKVRLIYAFDEPGARAAREAVELGDDFAQVAHRFNSHGILPGRGDLGYIRAGELPKELDDLLHQAPVGQSFGPIEVPAQGWFLMRVEERRIAAEQPTLDQIGEDLRNLLRQRKRRIALTRSVLDLRRAYDVRLKSGAADELVLALRPPGREELSAAPLNDGQRAIVLGEYRGGVYTLGEAASDLEQAPNRPNFNLRPTVERWLDTQVLERASLAESGRRRFAAEPRFQSELRERLNGYLLDDFYGRVVTAAISIGEDDIREAHRQRADSFIRLDEVRLQSAVLRDSAAAAQLVAHAGHSGTLREAAAMAAPGIRVNRETVRYPSADPFWGPLQAMFMQAAPRETMGPYPVDRGWIVFQLESKDQGMQTYEELPEAIKQHLMNQAVELKRETRLNAVTDSLRGIIPVVTHPRRALRIAWPVEDPRAIPGT